jgi:hypothetical protein
MTSSHGYRKGQYFSFDAIVASVIFVLTLVMLLSYWHSVRAYLDYQANDISKDASRISDMLFTPPTGECGTGTLTRLGLASSWTDKRMNQTLLECANGMDAASVTAVLGSSYGVSIVVTDTINARKYSIGEDVTDPAVIGNKTEVAKIRRIGTIATPDENHLATVDVYVYR